MARTTGVKFLQPEAIEDATTCLLADYGRKYGGVDEPPIPVEEVLEAHLGLTLEFDDLTERLELADVLGATWVRDRRVVIDQSLDPTKNPHREGRYRFTLAHEIGHWELHRHYFQDNPAQTAMFVDNPTPSIVCRTRSRKEPMEWQADTFAGYLLMPKGMVYRMWVALYGQLEPYVADEEIAELNAKWGLGEDNHPTVDVAREMAGEFKVSGQAMQIRLIGLG